MPVILLKYKPSRIPAKSMKKLMSVLPAIVSDALDVPEDPNMRLRAKDIQIWVLPENQFDVNLKPLQMLIPIHAYPQRVKNLEERKDRIVIHVRSHLVALGSDMIGFIWILPSSDTAFGKI